MVVRHVVTILALLSLPGLTRCFQPSFSFDRTSKTHRDITEQAVLRKTAEVCRDMAVADGVDFSLNIDENLSVTEVKRACSTSSTFTISTDNFQIALNSLHSSNTEVDFLYVHRAEYHFDSEAFDAGRDLITAGVFAVKANVKEGNLVTAREVLGRICHTLQDFYSHSNWVELRKTTPYSTLIRPNQPLETLAGLDVPTCKNCIGDNCEDNILPEVLNEGLITSGYFSFTSSVKPPGKCSHGGFFDRTSRKEPVGGINKDSFLSSHGLLHLQASNLAVEATMELLEDIRQAVGDRNFLRFMGLSQSSALCFAIDTTGSMRDDIAAVREVSFNIIDSRRGTPQEPSEYILVPFNDPDFGPVTRTTDADIFKEVINSLTASGGGDFPELSLSGVQLALTSAPPSSDIFVFTDASAKDANLANSVIALAENTRSAVTFMLTNVLPSRRRRRNSQSPTSRSLTRTDVQLYQDIAQQSGGQTIEVPKLDLSEATAVIEDLSASAVVTVFQVTMNPGRPDNCTFVVDASISNVIIYITGASSLTFRLSSPTGVSQMSDQFSGPLASITSVGNLRRISLNMSSEMGLWEVGVNSLDPYSVKVTGQSSVNFVYNLVEALDGAHSGFKLKDGRPASGGNVTLWVTVTGSDTVTVTSVTLVDSSESKEINGSLQPLERNNFLVQFTGVPAGGFVVRLTGEDSSSTSRSTPSRFQRQASTGIKTSSLSLTVPATTSNIEPGSTISIPFTVSSNTNEIILLRVSNDRGFAVTAPGSVTIEAGDGGEANGTVTLAAPANALSGTDVTLTIEAENRAATDINFAVLRFSVTAKVTDLSGPVCQVISISGICPASSSLCASSQWEFVANLTDGINGTGIASITLRQGNGTLNTSSVGGAEGEDVTVANYSATCCSQTVELTAVDRVGNVGRCVGRAMALTTPATTPVTTTNTTTTTTATNTTTPVATTNTPTPVTTPTGAVNTTECGGCALHMSHFLWVSVVVSLLCK